MGRENHLLVCRAQGNEKVFCKKKISQTLLIIHKEKTKKITTVKEICFCDMKLLGVNATPPRWDAYKSITGLPPAVCCWYPFIHVGEERHYGVKFLG